MAKTAYPSPRANPALRQETSACKARTFYRPELDLLRLLAFLMVFLHHTPYLPLRFSASFNQAGAFGVPIFFMLSAYLITELLMRERKRTSTVHVGAFYMRRILRIFPLYFFAIALGVLLGRLLPMFHVPLGALPWFLLLCGNLYEAHHAWASIGTLCVLWSVSVEEQFYLVVPVLARFGGRRALLGAASLSLAGAYVALVYLGAHHVNMSDTIWFNSFVHFQFFALGIGLAFFLENRSWRIPRSLRAGLFVFGLAGLLLAASATHLYRPTPYTLSSLCGGFALALPACAALFLAFHRLPVRAPRPLLYLGRISYGLYVYHPVTIGLLVYAPTWLHRRAYSAAELLLATAASFILTVLVASLSYELFEKRVLRYKDRFAYIASGADAAGRASTAQVAMPVGVST